MGEGPQCAPSPVASPRGRGDETTQRARAGTLEGSQRARLGGLFHRGSGRGEEGHLCVTLGARARSLEMCGACTAPHTRSSSNCLFGAFPLRCELCALREDAMSDVAWRLARGRGERAGASSERVKNRSSYSCRVTPQKQSRQLADPRTLNCKYCKLSPQGSNKAVWCGGSDYQNYSRLNPSGQPARSPSGQPSHGGRPTPDRCYEPSAAPSLEARGFVFV